MMVWPLHQGRQLQPIIPASLKGPDTSAWPLLVMPFIVSISLSQWLHCDEGVITSVDDSHFEVKRDDDGNVVSLRTFQGLDSLPICLRLSVTHP